MGGQNTSIWANMGRGAGSRGRALVRELLPHATEGNDVANYVGGKWVRTGDTLEDFSPATGEVIATVPRSTAADVDAAVEAAAAAQRARSEAPLTARSLAFLSGFHLHAKSMSVLRSSFSFTSQAIFFPRGEPPHVQPDHLTSISHLPDTTHGTRGAQRRGVRCRWLSELRG